eukprot:CAMPEP_0194495282 /NCGR_PEP_ID=MMETSP0253-20130528/12941_1 /TAXON_ID=2966 /ORGANISM="Noctiluca scintillans" /LENGTH=103 /DNA_ID=CAMNT_0039336523 /DNA_START=27 /DNA_END=338 /DNA_ORIENTATION=-
MKPTCLVILAVACSATVLKHEPLVPLGRGASQSADAVEQRTTDTRVACEEGRWEDCAEKDRGDLLDGHSYGHLRAKEDPQKVKSGVPTAACALWLTLMGGIVL